MSVCKNMIKIFWSASEIVKFVFFYHCINLQFVLKELEYHHHHHPYQIFKSRDWKIVFILAFTREDKHTNLLPEFFQQNLLHDKISQTMPCSFTNRKWTLTTVYSTDVQWNDHWQNQADCCTERLFMYNRFKFLKICLPKL